MSSPSWWQADRHAHRRQRLIQRNRIKEAVRDWCVTEGFTEVEAGILGNSPGNETHLHAFATTFADDAGDATLYLHTSPELTMKKLLAAGETKIFDFARVFRNRERGRLNVPEFTMLEWYRADADYRTVQDDCLAILRIAASTAGSPLLAYADMRADPFADAERLTVAEAFAEHAGIDLPATLTAEGRPHRRQLAAAAAGIGIRVAEDDTWSDIFSRVMAERIEPLLGAARPTLLCEYPAPEAALARHKPEDTRFAERFELFVCGVEIANGFRELTDPIEQRQRFEAAMAEKQRLYGERYPIDEAFLAALADMPEASGVALGFDRLVMLCVGADSVADVQWTPFPLLP
jgi:elongation factor P--(R)-beta-lysine ligase